MHSKKYLLCNLLQAMGVLGSAQGMGDMVPSLGLGNRSLPIMVVEPLMSASLSSTMPSSPARMQLPSDVINALHDGHSCILRHPQHHAG